MGVTTRACRSVALAVVVLLALLVAPAGPATSSVGEPAVAREAPRRVVFFDLYYHEKVKPRRIFFTANAGTYVRRLTWSGWGTDRAVAHGQYVSTCASCDPPRYRDATITFSRLRYCATRDVWFYRRGVMVREPSAGQTRRVAISAGSCPPADVDRVGAR